MRMEIDSSRIDSQVLLQEVADGDDAEARAEAQRLLGGIA